MSAFLGLPPLTNMSTKTTYEIIDRLHAGRAARVPGDRIASVVSSWLAELGADSPLTRGPRPRRSGPRLAHRARDR